MMPSTCGMMTAVSRDFRVATYSVDSFTLAGCAVLTCTGMACGGPACALFLSLQAEVNKRSELKRTTTTEAQANPNENLCMIHLSERRPVGPKGRDIPSGLLTLDIVDVNSFRRVGNAP